MFLEILGWVGAVVILAGYGLFSIGRLTNGPVYQLCNLVGAVCISANVASHGAWPSAIVNGVWAIIAAVVLIRMSGARRRARLVSLAAAATAAADAANERRIQSAEQAQLSPREYTASIPVVTAALAVVALAAAQHEVQSAAESDSTGARATAV